MQGGGEQRRGIHTPKLPDQHHHPPTHSPTPNSERPIILWAVVIVDYYVMNWHARGDFDIMVSGVLLLIIVVLAVFSSLVWVVRANYEESPVWIVRTTLAMIVARPLCSLLQVGLLILTVLVWVQWPGILMVFGLSLPMFCTAWIVYSFGRLPGMDIHDRMEQSTGRARNQTS